MAYTTRQSKSRLANFQFFSHLSRPACVSVRVCQAMNSSHSRTAINAMPLKMYTMKENHQMKMLRTNGHIQHTHSMLFSIKLMMCVRIEYGEVVMMPNARIRFQSILDSIMVAVHDV